MLEKIFSLFSKDPSADEKAVTISELLEELFKWILGYIGA